MKIKNSSWILIVLLTLLSNQSLLSQSDCYYYYFGEKIHLVEDYSKLTVYSKSTSKEDLLKDIRHERGGNISNVCFVEKTSGDYHHYRIDLSSITSKSDRSKLVDAIRHNEKTLIVYPYYGDSRTINDKMGGGVPLP